MTTTLARIALLVAAGSLIAACTGTPSDVEQWVAQQKQRKGAPLPPQPVIKTFETFIYQDQELRDPFAAAVGERSAGGPVVAGPRPDTDRVREPLESVPLDSLKMVGTIGAGASIIALLEDSSGVIHRVHDGNYVGQNYGHIVSVTEDRVELVELVPDGSGGWEERNATVALGGENP